jgi:hypothetical protein
MSQHRVDELVLPFLMVAVVLVASGGGDVFAATLAPARTLGPSWARAASLDSRLHPPASCTSAPWLAQQCPHLDSALAPLALALDPVAVARELGITTIDGHLRVIVELVPGARLAADIPLIVEAQYEGFVQALVPPGELCRLAADPAVALVRLPFPRSEGGVVSP